MKGLYFVKVSSSTVVYQFSINRNITIISGDSGTGKTILIERIADYNNKVPGISVSCRVPCIAIGYSKYWKNDILEYRNKECILLMDEDFSEIFTTKEFADIVKFSNCYYVLATRKNIKTLPYSWRFIELQMKRINILK